MGKKSKPKNVTNIFYLDLNSEMMTYAEKWIELGIIISSEID